MDYCTIALVKRLKLRPLYDVRLKIEGFNTIKEVDTAVYSVPVRRRDGRLEFIECYAVESLGDKCDLPDKDIYGDICSKIKVSMKKVAKPKRIELLLSLKSSHLMSDKLIKMVEGVKLFSGPLGFCVAGNIQQFLPTQQKEEIQVSVENSSSILSDYLPRKDVDLGSSDIRNPSFIHPFNDFRGQAKNISNNVSNRAQRLDRSGEGLETSSQPPA